MKKKIAILFFLILLIINSLGVTGYALSPTDFKSKSAVLINGDTGQILFEKNSNDKLAPASITKIMLLVLISEKMDSNEITLEQETTISQTASSMGGSQVFLEAYEVQTVENLLKAICMRSANDASVAMAEFMYGSEESCVTVMNDKAKELGMNNTNFINVTGLPEPNHYSTAYDISLMTKELLKYDYVNQYMTTWMESIYVGKNKDIEQVLVNTNRLINNYDGLLGGKTGYTDEAKYCLSAAAMRNNSKLIAVVLGCDDTKVRFAEVQKLLNDGFANYKTIVFKEKDDVVSQVPVRFSQSGTVDITVGERAFVFDKSQCKEEDYVVEYLINGNLKAPLHREDVIGTMMISKDNQIIKEINLYPKEDVNKESIIDYYTKMIIKNLLK